MLVGIVNPVLLYQMGKKLQFSFLRTRAWVDISQKLSSQPLLPGSAYGVFGKFDLICKIAEEQSIPFDKLLREVGIETLVVDSEYFEIEKIDRYYGFEIDWNTPLSRTLSDDKLISLDKIQRDWNSVEDENRKLL